MIYVAIGEKTERLYFHPYKPVSRLLTHQGIFYIYIYILFPFFSLYLLTGYYLYIETSTGIVGSKAVLVSPQYQQAYSNCKLKFSYHMYGSTVGSLAVFLNDGTSRTRMMMLIGLYSK